MKKVEKSGKKTGEIADEKLDKVSGGGLAAEYSATLDAKLSQPALKIPPKRILNP